MLVTTPNKSIDPIEDMIDNIKKTVKPQKVLKPGIIPFKTQEDLEDERTGEKALDEHWRKSGIADIIKK